MKKVLVITSLAGGDWGMDLLVAGLVQNLGPENVVLYPFRDKYVERIVKTGDKEKDWGNERRTLGWTPDNDRLSVFSAQEIFQMMVSGGISYAFVDERSDAFATWMMLRGNLTGVPVVVVAGHDRFWGNSPESVAKSYGKNFRHMFLDNWRPEYDAFPWASVYHWSTNFDHYWDGNRDQEKIYDISFFGYNSHPDRARFIDHVKKTWPELKLNIFLETRPGTFEGFIDKQSYFDIMARSKICLNLRGDAENGKTLRFYEIPYVGSCMVTQDTGAVITHSFVDTLHCMKFETEDELEEIIEELLFDEFIPDGWKNVARYGHGHVMKHHTSKVRVREMLEKLNG